MPSSWLNLNNIGVTIVMLVTGMMVLILACVIFVKTRNSGQSSVRSRFIEVVSHLFRTPLTGVKWALENFLTNEGRMTENEKINLLHAASDSIDRLLILIDTLTEIPNTRSEFSYSFQAVSLREMVDNILQNYRKKIDEKGIDLVISPSSLLPLLTVDVKRIQYVIETLLDNAVVYTRQNGRIGISFEQQKKGVLLRVDDNGIGLSWHDKRNLFTEFYRGKEAIAIKPDGMGLALYAAKKILGKHEGNIWAESSGSGRGSSFFMFLPV